MNVSVIEEQEQCGLLHEALCLNCGEVCDGVQRGDGNSNKRTPFVTQMFREMQKTGHKIAHSN